MSFTGGIGIAGRDLYENGLFCLEEEGELRWKKREKKREIGRKKTGGGGICI